MNLFDSFQISASALTAQRLRMDVISANIANAETTRGSLVNGKWQPYQRKLTVFSSNNSFHDIFSAKLGESSQGVKVSQIINDDVTPYKQVYDPTHPDANPDGYVLYPNVDLLREMVDMLSASRSYEANVTVFNTAKQIYLKALEIGRG